MQLDTVTQLSYVARASFMGNLSNDAGGGQHVRFALQFNCFTVFSRF
jgi:hypothetical protein